MESIARRFCKKIVEPKSRGDLTTTRKKRIDMGIVVARSQCKSRNSPRNQTCNFGVSLKNIGEKSYCIVFYEDTEEVKDTIMDTK
jgi:hypothetical protein